jgi:hypothetical protein
MTAEREPKQFEKPTDALLIQTTVPDLATGYLEEYIRNTAANSRGRGKTLKRI